MLCGNLFVLFLFVSCMFACFCLFDHMLSCLFDLFAWLIAFQYFLFYNNCRYGEAV